MREAYLEAYAGGGALAAGFDWYRAFSQNAVANSAAAGQEPVATPVLYLRGREEGGRMTDYLDGFCAAGLTHVEHGLLPEPDTSLSPRSRARRAARRPAA